MILLFQKRLAYVALTIGDNAFSRFWLKLVKLHCQINRSFSGTPQILCWTECLVKFCISILVIALRLVDLYGKYFKQLFSKKKERKCSIQCHTFVIFVFQVAMTREKFPEKIPFRLTRMLINAMEVSTMVISKKSFMNYTCRTYYSSLFRDCSTTFEQLLLEVVHNLLPYLFKSRFCLTHTRSFSFMPLISAVLQQKLLNTQKCRNKGKRRSDLGYTGFFLYPLKIAENLKPLA